MLILFHEQNGISVGCTDMLYVDHKSIIPFNVNEFMLEMQTDNNGIFMANPCVPKRQPNKISRILLEKLPYENSLLFARTRREKVIKMSCYMFDILIHTINNRDYRKDCIKDPECFFTIYLPAFVFYNTLYQKNFCDTARGVFKELEKAEIDREDSRECITYRSKMLLKSFLMFTHFANAEGKITPGPENAEMLILMGIKLENGNQEIIEDINILHELMRAGSSDKIKRKIEQWPFVPVTRKPVMSRQSHIISNQ